MSRLRAVATALLLTTPLACDPAAPPVGTAPATSTPSMASAAPAPPPAPTATAKGPPRLTPENVAAGKLSLGGVYSCLQLPKRPALCWGFNAGAELGRDVRERSGRPVGPVQGLAAPIRLSAGPSHACAIDQAGVVHCWGYNNHGRCGPGDLFITAPKPVAGLGPAIEVSAGVNQSCAVLRSGEVWCWGQQEPRKLTAEHKDKGVPPYKIDGISDARAVADGISHTCVVHAGGSVSCWGNHRASGAGSAAQDLAKPTRIAGIEEAIAVDAGGMHSCVLTKAGKVLCWGNNRAGQLAQPKTVKEKAEPTAVSLARPARALAVGQSNACAMVEGGAVWCWGQNQHGALGDGTVDNRHEPTEVPLAGPATDVALSWDGHGCALLERGEAYCWGRADTGQLGQGSADEIVLEPTPVTGVSNAKSLVGSQARTCAVMPSGALRCWGAYVGREDKLGAAPRDLAGLDDVAQAALGGSHGCVRHRSGQLSCWGVFGTDSHSAASGTPEAAAERVAGLSDLVEVRAGGNYTCTRDRQDRVHCWGDPELHRGAVTRSLKPQPKPQLMAGLSKPVALAVGGWHACACQADGTVACWGNNEHGQLGDGTHDSTMKPVAVKGVSNCKSLAAGAMRSCALLQDGTVSCWGSGLGDTPQAVRLPANTKAMALSGGIGHTCALLDGGQMACWGTNEMGELGLGYTSPSQGALLVPELKGVVEVLAAGGHSCARLQNGQVLCWGQPDPLGRSLGPLSAKPIRVPLPMGR